MSALLVWVLTKILKMSLQNNIHKFLPILENHLNHAMLVFIG